MSTENTADNSSVPTKLPTYDAAEQGLDSDRISISPAIAKRQKHDATYVGARRDLLERLKNGEVPGQELRKTPAVLKKMRRRGRAAIYLRVSTEEQARTGGGMEGYSIPFQREACRRYAEQLDLEIVGEYADLGKSGTTLSRPQFKLMISELRELGVTHLIVHKIDRLSRATKVNYIVDDELEKAGTTLVSVTEHVDDTPSGKMQLQFLRAVASYYSDNLGSEVLKGISMKLKAGGTPGQPPLGYLNKQEFRGPADVR